MTRTIMAVALTTSLITLAACEDTNDIDVDNDGSSMGDGGEDVTGDGGEMGDGGAEEQTAQIRVIHLSPDAPAVDVFANEAGPVVGGLAFTQGTDYLEVPAGDYDFAVSAAGRPAVEAVLEIPGLELMPDVAYTAVAYDTLENIAAMALVDDWTGLADSDIRVQVTHTAPGVGEVDIWAILENGAIPLLENVPFGAAAVLSDLPAGAYTVGFDVDNDAVPDVTFDLPALDGGTFVNLHAVNDVAGSVFLIAHLPDGTAARVDPS